MLTASVVIIVVAGAIISSNDIELLIIIILPIHWRESLLILYFIKLDWKRSTSKTLPLCRFFSPTAMLLSPLPKTLTKWSKITDWTSPSPFSSVESMATMVLRKSTASSWMASIADRICWLETFVAAMVVLGGDLC